MVVVVAVRPGRGGEGELPKIARGQGGIVDGGGGAREGRGGGNCLRLLAGRGGLVDED